MEKFKKTIRIILAVVAISSTVLAVASTTAVTVVFGCKSACN